MKKIKNISLIISCICLSTLAFGQNSKEVQALQVEMQYKVDSLKLIAQKEIGFI